LKAAVGGAGRDPVELVLELVGVVDVGMVDVVVDVLVALVCVAVVLLDVTDVVVVLDVLDGELGVVVVAVSPGGGGVGGRPGSLGGGDPPGGVGSSEGSGVPTTYAESGHVAHSAPVLHDEGRAANEPLLSVCAVQGPSARSRYTSLPPAPSTAIQ
jgi:hypothetical protein